MKKEGVSAISHCELNVIEVIVKAMHNQLLNNYPILYCKGSQAKMYKLELG